MTNEQRNKFIDLVCQLSPENLYCDGEVSQREAEVKYKQLRAEWRALEYEIKRTVTEWEILRG